MSFGPLSKREFKTLELLDFIELTPFTKRFEELGLSAEEDLWALQTVLTRNPKAGAVIQGTDGLRKVRFAPLKWNIGKSGATRCLYVYYEEFGIILLCLIYGKSETANISDAAKKLLNKLILQVKHELKRLQRLKFEERSKRRPNQ